MIIEKQDYMRREKRSKYRPQKTLSEQAIEWLAKDADRYGGSGTIDVMLDELQDEPTVCCDESMSTDRDY